MAINNSSELAELASTFEVNSYLALNAHILMFFALPGLILNGLIAVALAGEIVNWWPQCGRLHQCTDLQLIQHRLDTDHVCRSIYALIVINNGFLPFNLLTASNCLTSALNNCRSSTSCEQVFENRHT